MGAIAFDTHKFIKTLEKSGFKEELVTKGDVKDMATKLDIAEIKGELRLLKWMLTFVFVGVLSIVLKSFFM